MCAKLLCLLFKPSMSSLFSVLQGKCHLDSSGEGLSLSDFLIIVLEHTNEPFIIVLYRGP